MKLANTEDGLLNTKQKKGKTEWKEALLLRNKTRKYIEKERRNKQQ